MLFAFALISEQHCFFVDVGGDMADADLQSASVVQPMAVIKPD
jgi:hypothetical protein